MDNVRASVHVVQTTRINLGVMYYLKEDGVWLVVRRPARRQVQRTEEGNVLHWAHRSLSFRADEISGSTAAVNRGR